MNTRACLLALALISLVTVAHAAHIGPIAVQPVAAVYLVSDGQGASVNVTVTRNPQAYNPMPRFLLRVFDPDERMIHWRYVEYHAADTLPDVQPHEGIELPVVEEPPAANKLLHEVTLALDQPGVYQVRISTSSREVMLDIDSDRELGYGISCQNSDYLPWPEQPYKLFVYVPPHTERLTMRGGPYISHTEGGRVHFNQGAKSSPEHTVDIPAGETDTVWTFDFPVPDDWTLRAAGMPFILCNTDQAARDIHASVEVLPDGTVVCHKFQARIAALLPEVLSEENVGRTEDLIENLADRREAWLADPLRNLILTKAFPSVIEKWLRAQNLDPTGHWGGSLDGWRDKIDAAPPENRWDRLHGIEGLRAGASSDYGHAAHHLAIAATYDDPTNNTDPCPSVLDGMGRRTTLERWTRTSL